MEELSSIIVARERKPSITMQVEELCQVIDLWSGQVTYYNQERLHSSLEYLRPVDYYLVTRGYYRINDSPSCGKQLPGDRRSTAIKNKLD